MSSDKAIQLKGISKKYAIFSKPADRLKQMLVRDGRKYYKEVIALHDINISVDHGETVGIVGRNGSGKSTLLQVICGTVTPTAGELIVNGRLAAMLELGAGFNMAFSGRENVNLSGLLLGLSSTEIENRFDDIARFADIGDFIDQPVKTYSSGMFARLAFAIAINVDADILVIDEILSVGDEAFQRKCFSHIQKLKDSGTTILFVSHSAGNVIELCDRAILLDHGERLLTAKSKDVIGKYQKLTYAPSATIAAVQQQIRMFDKNCEIMEENFQGANAEGIKEASHKVAQFDPSLIPSSTVEHESQGALISNVRILNSLDEEVNILLTGEVYTYAYEVHFSERAFGVHFGMFIKSMTGVELGGMGSHPVGQGIEVTDAGQDVLVRFRFRNNLLHGTYFTNAGCVGQINGEETFLHRIIDADMFKIEPLENTRAQGGYVAFAEEPASNINYLDHTIEHIGRA